jgi:hypothetical protein
VDRALVSGHEDGVLGLVAGGWFNCHRGQGRGGRAIEGRGRGRSAQVDRPLRGALRVAWKGAGKSTRLFCAIRALCVAPGKKPLTIVRPHVQNSRINYGQATRLH